MTILKRNDTEAYVILHTFSFLRHEEMKVYPKSMLNWNSWSIKIGNVVTGDLLSDSSVSSADKVHVWWSKIRNLCISQKQNNCVSFPTRVKNAGSHYVFKRVWVRSCKSNAVVLVCKSQAYSGWTLGSTITVTAANGPSDVNTSR